MGQPRPLFHLFRLFKQTLQFLQQVYVENCLDHPSCGAGIRTHDLLNTRHLPLPLDQGSQSQSPILQTLYNLCHKSHDTANFLVSTILLASYLTVVERWLDWPQLYT